MMWTKHLLASTLLAAAQLSLAEPDRPLSYNPGGPMIPASSSEPDHTLSFNPGGPMIPASSSGTDTTLYINPGGPMIAASPSSSPDNRLSINPGGPMIPACPTITTTAQVCSTCITNPCVKLSTIVNPGICPSHVPTVTKKFPCHESACPGGCSTQCVLPWTTSTTTPAPTDTPCPTVTEVRGRCSTCVMPMCEAISIIKSVCGCPKVVPTLTTKYSCDGKCPGGCAGTTYVYDTATPTCTA